MAILSHEEQIRAQHYYFAEDRDKFIVGRVFVRLLLGRYLGADPAHLEFCYGQNGKPLLPCFSDGKKIRFNLSHSRGLALCAITCDKDIGIDLEFVRPITNLEQLVERFFSAREYATLHALPLDERLLGFFTCWTRKEALLKATGEGLKQSSLENTEISLPPEEFARNPSTKHGFEKFEGWSLKTFIPKAGYISTIAVKGDVYDLKCWTWLE